MQLLTVAIPALERLQKSGPDGQEKIKRITRYVTVALAIVTAYGYYLTIRSFLYTTNWFGVPCYRSRVFGRRVSGYVDGRKD